ncbi:MAG TPA: helix-turn-helix transcriptional regulator [Puia sp.]|nr:helix-turn-helix transcriptional regulator [Puia sp.]
MRVQTFHPPVSLAPFIREFMIIESDLGTDSRILPDTSMVMAFRYKGNVQRMEGELTDALPAAVITGLRRSHRIMRYSGQTSNLLVVFKEGGLAAFSAIPAHELFDQTISADNLFSINTLDEILHRLAMATTDKTRVDIMGAFLLQHLTANKQDLLIDKAIQLIQQRSGLVKIKDLAVALHISQDPFEKRFRTQVGSTPKQYASIIRLRKLIDTYPAYSSLTEAAYEAGYFDQSHFIKDFRLFTGQTPKDFFKSSGYW